MAYNLTSSERPSTQFCDKRKGNVVRVCGQQPWRAEPSIFYLMGYGFFPSEAAENCEASDICDESAELTCEALLLPLSLRDRHTRWIFLAAVLRLSVSAFGSASGKDVDRFLLSGLLAFP